MPCRCVDGLLAVQLVLTSSGTLYCSFFVLHSAVLVLYSASASGSDGGFACRRSWIPCLSSFLRSMAIVWAIRYKADTEASVERLLEREEEDGILLCKCVEELRRKGMEFGLLKEVDALRHAKILRVEAKGLLRCGKSCRLRWLNYLKRSIKRGNFTKDEEETIIRLHEQLGNRWSAIAAELPGRTDNEIKNVWNTHLKKRLKLNQLHTAKKVKAKLRCKAKAEFMPVIGDAEQAKSEEHTSDAVPALQSYSEMSSSGTISSSVTSESYNAAMKEDTISSCVVECSDIEGTFLSETLSLEGCRSLLDCKAIAPAASLRGTFSTSCWSYVHKDDDLDDWLKVFMETGKFQELPEL